MTAAERRRALITGIGTVNAIGGNAASSWQALLDGKSAIGPIRRFDASGLQVSLAAEVTQFQPPKEISRRLLAKSDRFAHFALAATAQALADACGDLAEEDPFRIGISFGNNSGGWDICERGFEEYYQQGPPMINPGRRPRGSPPRRRASSASSTASAAGRKASRATGKRRLRRLFRTARAALGTQRRDARGRIGSARDQAGSRCPRVNR